MAVVKSGEIDVAAHVNGIRLQVGGKIFILNPNDALSLGDGLHAAAMHHQMLDNTRLPLVENILLSPFDQHGLAALDLKLKEIGSVVVAIDGYWIDALTKVAESALENAQTGGSA